jgi:hypothetical protein
MSGIALPPVDGRRDGLGHCDHAGAGIDADNAATIADPVPGEPRHDTGAARHIEQPVVPRDAGAIQQFLRKRMEQRRDQKALVHLGQATGEQALW